MAEELGQKVDEVFDPESGHLSKSLDELFSDGSSTAVQHRVKELVAEALQRSREDLRKQFSSTDERATRSPTSRRARSTRSRRPTSASTRPSARCSRR